MIGTKIQKSRVSERKQNLGPCAGKRVRHAKRLVRKDRSLNDGLLLARIGAWSLYEYITCTHRKSFTRTATCCSTKSTSTSRIDYT